MTASEQGRFCAACQKTVVDFTAMDDQELLKWFATHQGSVCGRLKPDQLNRPLPAPTERNTQRYWHYLIAALLVSTEVSAQTKPARPATSQQLPPDTINGHLIGDTVIIPDKPSMPDSIRGRVVDESGKPISYATVMYSPKNGVAVDAQGYFAIPSRKVSRYQQLTITAVGYHAVAITVDKLLTEHQVAIAEIVARQEDVVAGFVTVVTKKRRKRIAADTVAILKDTLATLGLTKPALTAYPNPVARGGAITITARLDQKGKYSLQLYNSSGTIVESRELDRIDNATNLTMPIPEDLVPGIYFVKLSRPAMTKCYSQQVMVY